MTRLMSRALVGASAFALAALSATPASAQRVDRIIAFGDSYADDGNAFQLGYANPQALAIYPTGRFSGGTNYIDTLSQILHAPVENFAIGGAFGGTNNGTLCFDSFYAPGTSPLCGRGLQYEIDQFFNVGTQSAAFPDGSPSFDANDLVAVSIGGNDARFYQQAGGSLAGATAAGTAAAVGTSLQLDRLVAAGAPTISFLALNGALAPEVATNPTAQAIRGAHSTAFYNVLQTTLAGYAAGGTIVHYLDGALLLQQVAANPGAYGITNGLVCPVFPNTTCIQNSAGYLFYGDALHLTSGGFAIVAQYVAAQLTAPLTLQAPSDVSLDLARQFGRTLTDRADLSAPRFGDAAEGFQAFMIGDALSRRVDASSSSHEFTAKGFGLTIGAEYGFGNGVAGIAANISGPDAEFATNAADVNSEALQIGAYGAMAFGAAFVQAYAGYGRDDYDIDRRGVVTPMEADTEGDHWLAGAKAGYLLPVAGLRLGPIVALDYAQADVDGYTESGDPALTLNVGSTDVDSLRGSIGAEVRADIDSGGVQLRPYGALVLEKELSGSDRSISFAQTSSPGIVNRFNLDEVSKKAYGRLTIGATAGIFGGVLLDAGLSATAGKDNGDESSAHLGVKLAF